MLGNRVQTSINAKIMTLLFTQLLLFGLVHADEDFTPVYNPTMEVSKITGEIKIDGDLDDSGWQSAAKVDNFAEHSPGDQTKPPVNTEAFITYDDNKLYIAMICYDDPSVIRASFCERDRGVGADDNICLLIDTYGDASWAYELNVNPYGIQADAIWSQNGGEDDSYDMIWESAGKITDSGYQVEVAIPFSSLRFPNKKEQVWKMDFWRNHPREVRGKYSWAAYDRDEPCWPCKWGTVTGIHDVKPGKGIEIMPSFIGYKAGALLGDGTPLSPYDFINEKADGELSIGGKYAVSSNITVEATYNPDFSQVEADANQIDVNSSIALYLNEKRPFFQEGSDLFGSYFNVVYTRAINDPEFAAKVTARMDKTSVAYMLARDETTPMILPFEDGSKPVKGGVGKSTSNILRVRRNFGEDSHLGFLATDRRIDGGGSGSLLSADMGLRLTKNYRFMIQTIATHSEEPNDANFNDSLGWRSISEDGTDTTVYVFDKDNYTTKLDGEKFWGHATFIVLSRESANFYTEFSYLERSPTFRADNGYQQLNNMRSLQSHSLYHFRFDNGLLERLTPSLLIRYKKNFANELKQRVAEFGLEGNLRFAQMNFHANYKREATLYKGEEFNDVWRIHNCIHARPSAMLAFGGSINYGHQIAKSYMVMGKEFTGSFWFDLKPINRLLIENSYNYVKSDSLETGGRLYEGYTLFSRWNLQITKGLSFRLVGQYDDFSKSFDLDPLLTYRVNPFSIFYIGSTYDYGKFETFNDDEQEHVNGSSTRLASRQFFMKLQYLFQL
ncbi:MAG: carbohydrate binding family 9 domain-containing protein [candidate division Zixibacteria bacterium]|nr:carbohydrate binding family 9 domain-containing protein [candidate division Zixibacteria bacterium]